MWSLAFHGAHNAAGDRRLEPEGIAHGQHHVTDLNVVGVSETGDGDFFVGLEHNQRQVLVGIGPDQRPVELAVVVEPDRDVVGAPGDVVVGQDVHLGAVASHQDAGPDSPLFELSRLSAAVGTRIGTAEKELQRRRCVAALTGDALHGIQLDHYRQHLLGDAAQRVLVRLHQCHVALRRTAVLAERRHRYHERDRNRDHDSANQAGVFHCLCRRSSALHDVIQSAAGTFPHLFNPITVLTCSNLWHLFPRRTWTR